MGSESERDMAEEMQGWEALARVVEFVRCVRCHRYLARYRYGFAP